MSNPYFYDEPGCFADEIVFEGHCTRCDKPINLEYPQREDRPEYCAECEVYVIENEG